MDERLKLIRKHFHLSQERFADRLGIKRSAISNYEIGRNVPIDAVVSLICREFNVDETWLRTGKGEMLVQMAEDPVEHLCKELHATKLDSEIIRAYFKIDERIREPFMRQLLEQMHAPLDEVDTENTTTTPARQERPEPDIVAKVADLERQNQELAAKIAAMEEEDALLGFTDVSSKLPSVSVGNFSPSKKAKK